MRRYLFLDCTGDMSLHRFPVILEQPGERIRKSGEWCQQGLADFKTDTLNGPVIQGRFMITNVKPGNYILMLEGKPPYRDSFKQDVLVVEGQPTDVGVIRNESNKKYGRSKRQRRKKVKNQN